MPTASFIHVILPLRLDWEPLYRIPGTEGTPRTGTRVEVDFAGKVHVGVVAGPASPQALAGVSEERIKPVLRVLDELEDITPEEIALWRQVAGYYLCAVGEVYKAAYPAGKTGMERRKARADAREEERRIKRENDRKERLRRKTAQLQGRIEKLELMAQKARKEETRARYLAGRDAARQALQALSRCPDDGPEAPAHAGAEVQIRLSPAQEEAWKQLQRLRAAGKTAYLHGVTGSGKTEIYLKLAQEVLREGRSVLYLVPEIALSRQMEERIERVFPEQTVIFHSGETPARRRDAAGRIRQGGCIVLGTRSAVFLPHRKLGLVIVDEEQDLSYKQDAPAPRYNARETAIMLSQIHGAAVVLGSATPSLEAAYNCHAGRFSEVRLTQRYFEAPDADVLVIDTLAERRKNGMVGHLSRKLIDAVRECVREGGQAILLRERRSYSPALRCTECGEIPRCHRCGIPMSLHRRPGGDTLVCHHCGRTKPYTGRCPQCGGALELIGAGTQQIEEEVRTLFPDLRVARLDGDAARSRPFETETIRRFAQGETDILVGTQILSKGFDFSGLRLVAVLQADAILGQQDFRADEKALQLLEQFRGRCGRRTEKGLFILQTARPDHPVYRTLDGTFTQAQELERLLAERKAFGYPPFTREVTVILRDARENRLEEMGRVLARRLAPGAGVLDSGVTVVGPYPPPVEMVSGEHVRHIRILLPKNRGLSAGKAALRAAVDAFGKACKYAAHLALDVDPV